MNKNILIVIIIALLVVAGIVYFSDMKKADQSQAITASYSDGSNSVEASFLNDTVTFTHPSVGTVTLPQAVSGSGARYANADESIVFWEHQGELTITKDGSNVFMGAVDGNNATEEPEEEEENSGGVSSVVITSNPWVWDRTTNRGGETVRPVKTDAFSITFGSDGSISGTTDCNGFGGTYALGEDGAVTFSDFASTLMFCEGSQETEFVQAVANADHYIIDPSGNLILDLKDNSGEIYLIGKR